MRAFCRQEGIREPSFYAWRRKLTESKATTAKATAAPDFVPAVVETLPPGERALKRVALGRKNWLFAGNDAAAENHARLWSLIASCERHGVDPQRYLTSVLAKIGTTPAGDLAQFLPDLWNVEDKAEPMPGE